MQPKMITIATFESAVQAHIARNKLDEAGIVAAISNEAISATAWQLTGAFGGVGLHVRAEDVDKALMILEEKAPIEFGSRPSDMQETQDEFTEDDFQALPELDEEEDSAIDLSETEADRIARRSFKAAMLGILFPPLQLYSIWLLALFLFEPSTASRSSRLQVVGAWFISLSVLSLFVPLIAPIFLF